ncbi:Crp/Fnr family transcriptional regulator [Candidatus Binatus sp.]|uniref:Crp/Fnr family transcriptional regulator n=1 Tax=Candidatus Binatus sp. TaxID=2811406 RepID=UPI003BAF6043
MTGRKLSSEKQASYQSKALHISSEFLDMDPERHDAKYWPRMTFKTAQLPLGHLDPSNFLAKVGRGIANKSYRKNRVIFAQGDVCTTLFFIKKGKVKRTRVSAKGKEAIVGILGANDFFGESCMAGLPRRIVSAIAMTDCVVIEIEKRVMIRILRENPVFAERFTTYLLNRNVQIEEALLDQILNTSEKRLARALLLLANFGVEVKPDLIVTGMSQETLAAIVGTTRARVNFFMNKFRKLGLLDYNGGIQIHRSLRTVLRDD